MTHILTAKYSLLFLGLLFSHGFDKTKKPIAHGPCWRSDQSFASNWFGKLESNLKKTHKIPGIRSISNENPLIFLFEEDLGI